MVTFEISFYDLTEEKQKEYLDIFGAESYAELEGADTSLAIIDFDEDTIEEIKNELVEMRQ